MTELREAVIVATARTPMGRYGGQLKDMRPDDLAAIVLKEACERAHIKPGEVSDVILGCANQAGEDNRNVARMALLLAGFPVEVPGQTVNRLGGSGMQATIAAAREIQAGAAEIVIAGGVESMTRAPWVMPKPDGAFPRGPQTVYDTALGWRLINPKMAELYGTLQMGETAERVAQKYEVSREEQDAFALRSHQRAVAAQKSGRLAEEIVSMRVATKPKGKLLVDKLPAAVRARIPVFAGSGGREASIWDHVAPDAMVADPATFSPFVTGDVPHAVVDRDEAIRDDANLAAMAKLQPIDRGGSVTAANAPGVSDGACAIVLASASYARSHGHDVLGTIVDHATVAWDSPYISLTPAMAARKLLDRNGYTSSDIAVWEINEAFSAVAITSSRRLELEEGSINKFGGAVAMGHPIGASGSRIVGTLINQLRKRGGGFNLEEDAALLGVWSAERQLGLRAQLRAVAQELESIQTLLRKVAATLPAPPREGTEPEARTPLRAVIECVLVDSLEPAIGDLRAAVSEKT